MIVEQTLVLEAAPAALWPWISEPERLAQWISDAQRFEARPAGPLAPGSTLVVHLPRGATPVEARVERVAPSRELALRARGLPNDMEVALSFALRAEGSGTRLVLRAETELTGFLIFAEKMIASKAQTKLAGWAEKLRALVAAG
jgi:carbon monoxide dehydrogenase subunit G